MTPHSDRTSDGVVLDVTDLEVTFNTPTGPVPAVQGLSFVLEAGKVLGIVGESGSGKSTTFRALLGLAPSSADIDGTVDVRTGGTVHSGAPREVVDELRAATAMVYQNPGAALNPVFTIGQQLALAAGDSATEPNELAQLLADVGLPDPEKALDSYPHEFSGGMRQRAVIAMALAKQPAILIADEPTSALDVTTQQRILDLVDELRQRHQLAVAFISHDLHVVEQIADRVAVLKDGRIVESGPTSDVLTNPQHDYTKSLVASGRRKQTDADETIDADPLLTVRGLAVEYRSRADRGQKVRAVDGIDLTIARGETLALVGESGSGKSTLANAVVGLAPVTEGSIVYDGTELVGLAGRARRPIQRLVQMVFQNPLLSFNPRRRIGVQLEAPMKVHLQLTASERSQRIEEMAADLGLEPDLLDRFPHELSGGQAQRLVLARALLLKPEMIVFDEPTSALDVSVQAAVLELLDELKARHELTYLFITHDLAVARQIADQVAVMFEGEIVEMSGAAELFADPQHEYTQVLLGAAQC